MKAGSDGNLASSGYVNLNYADGRLTYEVHVSNLQRPRSVQLRLGDSEQGGIVVAILYKAAFEPTSANVSNGLLAQVEGMLCLIVWRTTHSSLSSLRWRFTSQVAANNLWVVQGSLNDYDLVGPMELPKGRYVTTSQLYEW